MMPFVSIIIPCFNEETTIRLLLTAITEQTYPVAKMEIVIADGLSTDNTRTEIQAFQAENPRIKIRLVDNKKQNIPSGLNRAIEAAEGEIIVRLDAHSVPASDYIEQSVAALEANQGDNVGGVWQIQPGNDSWVARSIAVAAAHPLGVGDASYRVGGQPQLVDTVPFGSFRREFIDQVGHFDESLLSNEDYELNVRIRKLGGRIWLDPGIKTKYFARKTLRELARQYWRYGYWKLRMLTRYPETFRWRQLSGAFVLTWLVLGLASVWLPLARGLLLLETIVYGGAISLAGIQAARKHKDFALLFGVPTAIAVMHFSWGTAFLWSYFTYLIAGNDPPDKSE
jgi:succinoglycan biosynthesis protein ExoA